MFDENTVRDFDEATPIVEEVNLKKEDKLTRFDVRPVTLTLEEGQRYVLDFTRNDVNFATRHGFDIKGANDDMIGFVYDIFYYAFHKNHPSITREETDAIIDDYFGGAANVEPKLVETLSKLYINTYTTLVEGKNLKKVTL